jgi:hypothetical protein
LDCVPPIGFGSIRAYEHNLKFVRAWDYGFFGLLNVTTATALALQVEDDCRNVTRPDKFQQFAFGEV